MSNTAENPKSEREIEAREALMREQFAREADEWEKATPVEKVLDVLKAKIDAKK